MLGERFIIILNDGRRIEADTYTTAKHKVEGQASKFPLSSGAKTTDHVVLDPKTTMVEACYSDTPVDESLQPSGALRAQRVHAWLEQAIVARLPVQVFAGYKVFPAALLTMLEVDDTLANAGMLRASLRIEEQLTVTARTVQLVKRKAKHKPKAQKGQKFATKIAAVKAGTAASVQ